MKYKLRRIGIIGGGAWGTALAVVASHGKRDVVIWSRNAETVHSINAAGTNPSRLPGVRLPSTIKASTDPASLKDVDAAFVALPSHAVEKTLQMMAPILPSELPVIVATKGLEPESGRYLTAVVIRNFSAGDVFALSGPSFAADVARGRPAAVVLAGETNGPAHGMAHALATPSLRIYPSNDLIGVQAGGLIKNALAIACGICDGMGLGDSARAALITRGSFELIRLGRELGGRMETLQGLSGLGDLILTATSGQSRNFTLGRALGMGRTLTQALAESAGVCEGVNAAIDMADVAGRSKIEVPIIAAVAAVVSGKSTPRAEMERLMERPLTTEQLAS